MNESIFETMEQLRVVDRVLLWVALAVPLLVAAGYRALRERPIVRRWRHRWIMTCVLAPVPFVMWKIYNAVADHYGLESVFGMFVNALIFGVVTVVLAAVNFALYAVLAPDAAPPKPPPSDVPATATAPAEPAEGTPSAPSAGSDGDAPPAPPAEPS